MKFFLLLTALIVKIQGAQLRMSRSALHATDTLRDSLVTIDHGIKEVKSDIDAVLPRFFRKNHYFVRKTVIPAMCKVFSDQAILIF